MPQLPQPGLAAAPAGEGGSGAAAPAEGEQREKGKMEDHLLTIASDLEQRGEKDTALTFYERAATLSDDAATRVKLGDAYVRSGRIDNAISAYRAALAKAPDDGGALLGLGGALIRGGKVQEGHDILVKAIAAGKSQVALNRLGLAEIMLGKPHEALATFEEAVALNERDADVKTNLALAAALNDQHEKAIGIMRTLVETQPSLQHRRNLILVMGIAGRGAEVRGPASKGIGEAEIKTLIARAEKIRALSTPKARALAFASPG